ncbi:MAG TPA: hypothetical protein PKO25_13750 [Spirochaetota bacterium]|jgi:hypothetical protein|nr:hypothetical protein [Spirochaetota bacterium]OPZ36280.1 MAG: hypothetical protein BWY96_02329 [Spirochaetes bacterium ADurb.BinA120]HNU92932.1 hypothetical protein [Spirochaetota bacterium]HPI14071.1 hypothetical protein [Spirochaetota bacterium]HPV96813.1 hypothetical protein [Spirochaetota bacterium]
MKFSVLEIFFIFWLSAFLWVLVEYLYQRINRREKSQLNLEPLERDRG